MENPQFLTAAFSGDPAGRHHGIDLQDADDSGTNFSFGRGVFGITEVQYLMNQGKAADGPLAVYKLGAWYHSAGFSDERLDNLGNSLASPSSTGVPMRHRGNYAIHAVADQAVWRDGDAEGLNLFTRNGGAPADRNVITFYADAGAALRGAIPGRADDTLGVAVSHSRVSSDASQLDRDAQIFSGVATPVRDHETIIEWTYIAQVAPWWNVQPDVQHFIHPGDHIPDPNDPGRAIPDALVLGLRTTLKFLLRSPRSFAPASRRRDTSHPPAQRR